MNFNNFVVASTDNPLLAVIPFKSNTGDNGLLILIFKSTGFKLFFRV